MEIDEFCGLSIRDVFGRPINIGGSRSKDDEFDRRQIEELERLRKEVARKRRQDEIERLKKELYY
nr:MAG TPA: CHD-like protein [Caudoviricetes sp.]